jgi:hypothetical protein
VKGGLKAFEQHVLQHYGLLQAGGGSDSNGWNLSVAHKLKKCHLYVIYLFIQKIHTYAFEIQRQVPCCIHASIKA